MQRSIKFRYTVIRENGYIFNNIFTLEQIEKGEVETWRKANFVNMDTVKKDQYIGRHDKNGKEIYEGDIYRWLGHEVENGKQVRPERIRTVEDNIVSCHKLYCILSANSTVEVIGNIYEHSHLLRDKNSEPLVDG